MPYTCVKKENAKMKTKTKEKVERGVGDDHDKAVLPRKRKRKKWKKRVGDDHDMSFVCCNIFYNKYCLEVSSIL